MTNATVVENSSNAKQFLEVIVAITRRCKLCSEHFVRFAVCAGAAACGWMCKSFVRKRLGDSESQRSGLARTLHLVLDAYFYAVQPCRPRGDQVVTNIHTVNHVEPI